MSIPVANTKTDLTFDSVERGGYPPGLEQRWIGRCKRCGATHKLEGSLAIARRGSQSYQVVRAPGGVYMCDGHGSDPSRVVVPCGDHWCLLRRVYEGDKKSKHECGARCTNATGPNCDCRCKGKNHGSHC